jgi:CAAX prenyl protease-like protein
VPFGIFVGLTACQGTLFDGSQYWFYLLKTVVGAGLIWAMYPLVSEMRWALSWEAVAAGVGVFGIWVGLDGYYHKFITAPANWHPFVKFGDGSALAWLFIVTRILGSTLVVPPLEEVFYRSFAYRSLAAPKFETVPLNYFAWLPFLGTAALFGFSHVEWLAGILCGMAYQFLVLRKNRLGDAMTAHAITNFLLGGWIVWRGDWHFW